MSDAHSHVDDLCRLAEQCWAQERPQEALDAAWAAFDCHAGRRTRPLVARLLEHYSDALQPERRESYLTLLKHPEVEPDLISTAGWRLWLRTHWPAKGADAADNALAAALEHDELPLTLLQESPVYFAPAERLLTRLRQNLLASGALREFPKLVAGLKVQASLNGGAWPFDGEERALLAQAANKPMRLAYLPDRPKRNASRIAAADPVTRAVAGQYEAWPYPAWTRITVGEPRRLPDVVRPMDAELAAALPIKADMLVAGCGTGRQAAYVAKRYPDATIAAIDISDASLDYARRQCRAAGVENILFLKLDLHDVASLGRCFHSIHCAGVLHHLPDPERGLKLLADVLHPAGVMHIMIYNRIQRLTIAGARTLMDDLLQQPVNDDLLRRVRARLLQQPEKSLATNLMTSRDFATLAGAHDLLLHRHEDPFDVTRIEHGLIRARLRLLSFDMPPPAAVRYDAMFPDDAKHRNIKSWSRFVRTDPAAATGHFRFWCAKSAEPST